MPFYQYINPRTTAGKRTLEHLQLLRESMQEEIPAKTLEGNLLLATWNIREFGTTKYGGRTQEAYYYIAEIVSKFDLIAIQEVREDLAALKALQSILGSHWSYLFTDVTEGSQGNGERLAFLFDTRKVRFGGLAGEMVLPPLAKKDPETGQTIYEPVTQLARTPYLCGFRAGWTDFQLATVHIIYGDDGADNPARVKEIKAVATMLADRASGKYAWSDNIVLLGDFNIYSPADQTYRQIEDAGFTIPAEIKELPGSNVPKNKFYDQIAFKIKQRRFETTGKAGVFDYYRYVYTLEEEALYHKEMGDAYETTSAGKPRTDSGKTRYYKSYWRTYKMSDHLPMWVEIKIDYTDSYLASRLLPPQSDPPAVAPTGG